jgi:hypothetical protein
MSSLNSDACVQIRGKHAEYSSDVPPLHPIALLDVSNAILELEKLAESVCADPVNATTQDVHWDTITVDGVCVCVCVWDLCLTTVRCVSRFFRNPLSYLF